MIQFILDITKIVSLFQIILVDNKEHFDTEKINNQNKYGLEIFWISKGATFESGKNFFIGIFCKIFFQSQKTYSYVKIIVTYLTFKNQGLFQIFFRYVKMTPLKSSPKRAIIILRKISLYSKGYTCIHILTKNRIICSFKIRKRHIW